ncbi:alpha/beta hydrolase family protein [Sphingomonas sp. ID0503]|uniref:alpha/beta hydrolase family protein n=1 Tax=Sphingomonas sp. ID0503 TaxID=3399691 RepID=UPI003AFABCB9
MIGALALALLAVASIGEMHRVTQQPSGKVRDARQATSLRVTAWYRAAAGARETSIDIGPSGRPFFALGPVAMDGAFADGVRRPVILLSHGFGGSARAMAWFGKALAGRGYVVVAVDHPGNNGIDQMTAPGAALWWERAEDLKLALRAVAADAVIGPHLDTRRIGVAGFSLGGLTALIAGGARVSPENVERFCRERPDDGICRPQIEFAVSAAQARDVFEDPKLKSETNDARADHSVPGVRAVFAMAPVVQPLDPASLRRFGKPLSIVVGADDVTVPARTQAEVAKALVPGGEAGAAARRYPLQLPRPLHGGGAARRTRLSERDAAGGGARWRDHRRAGAVRGRASVTVYATAACRMSSTKRANSSSAAALSGRRSR